MEWSKIEANSGTLCLYRICVGAIYLLKGKSVSLVLGSGGARRYPRPMFAIAYLSSRLEIRNSSGVGGATASSELFQRRH